jgi:DNA-3-methyladenine glycosylase II
MKTLTQRDLARAGARPQRLRDVATEAEAHLRRSDPTLARLIDDTGPLDLTRRLQAAPHDHFGALMACLVGQRQPERTTVRQFVALRRRTGQVFPSPMGLLSLPELELAALLNSHVKVRYLRQLARQVLDGQVRLDDLEMLDEPEVERRLLAIQGVGPWSIEQILFWHLERPDVLVTGDPAVRRAFCSAFGMPEWPEPIVLSAVAAPWMPYRSYVAHLLLQSTHGPGESRAWPRDPRPTRHAGPRRAHPDRDSVPV